MSRDIDQRRANDRWWANWVVGWRRSCKKSCTVEDVARIASMSIVDARQALWDLCKMGKVQHHGATGHYGVALTVPS